MRADSLSKFSLCCTCIELYLYIHTEVISDQNKTHAPSPDYPPDQRSRRNIAQRNSEMSVELMQWVQDTDLLIPNMQDDVDSCIAGQSITNTSVEDKESRTEKAVI